MLTIVNKKKVYIDSRTKERIPFIARIICMTTNGSLVCFEILSSFPITSFDYNFHDTQNDTFHRRLSSPQDLSVRYFKVDWKSNIDRL